jgi:hypothetical protein
MVDSGNQGGNPVISKPGRETKAGNLCFSNLGEVKLDSGPKHDFGDNIKDISKIPVDLLQEKIKLTLMGIDKDVIQAFIEK